MDADDITYWFRPQDTVPNCIIRTVASTTSTGVVASPRSVRPSKEQSTIKPNDQFLEREESRSMRFLFRDREKDSESRLPVSWRGSNALEEEAQKMNLLGSTPKIGLQVNQFRFMETGSAEDDALWGQQS
ncbi:hypothetical protein Tco_0798629 [Tanacetum coccineum]